MLLKAARTFFENHPFGFKSVYLALSFIFPNFISILKFMVRTVPDQVMSELIEV